VEAHTPLEPPLFHPHASPFSTRLPKPHILDEARRCVFQRGLLLGTFRVFPTQLTAPPRDLRKTSVSTRYNPKLTAPRGIVPRSKSLKNLVDAPRSKSLKNLVDAPRSKSLKNLVDAPRSSKDQCQSAKVNHLLCVARESLLRNSSHDKAVELVQLYDHHAEPPEVLRTVRGGPLQKPKEMLEHPISVYQILLPLERISVELIAFATLRHGAGKLVREIQRVPQIKESIRKYQLEIINYSSSFKKPLYSFN
jgi:hypothetical protein